VYLETMFLKPAARSDKIYYKQINSVFVVIACLPGHVSHHHYFLYVEVIFKVGDGFSVFIKGVAEKKSDCLSLFSD